MSNGEAVIDQFLQTWIEEFTRAVEMFSGQVPNLRCSRAKTLSPAETEDLVWWKQDFVGTGKFSTWIGVKNETLIALGGATDPVEAKSTYLEMIGQAQSGAAHVVSSGMEPPLKAEPGEESTAPDFETLCYGIIGLTFGGTELPSLVFALQPTINDVLKDDEPEEIPATAQSTGAQSPVVAVGNHAMLSRLMELELPLSIALGRAMLPIREVLKVTSGSVIELDRNVGDNVELLVHGTVVARGEVVSVKGNYGVRIKEIISQQDRMHLYKRQ